MEGYSYDEDLAENRFFIIMQTKYRQLYQQAASQRLLICIPRTGVFARFSLNQADFETHILLPSDGKSGHYTTLNNKEVQLSGDAITTTKGFKEIRIVHILFEETYYNDRDESYRVVCIDRQLEGGNEVVEDPVSTCLETLDDCTDFLWGSKYSKFSQKQVDDLITNFRNTNQQMETLRHTIDETSSLFASTMQIALKDSVLRKTVRQHHGHMDNLKTSMETYILHGVYGKVFKAISSFLASQDAALNKITRNLSELQVRDVGVRPEFTANVPRARRELSTLNQYRTPLEKLHCLRRTVMAISQPGFRARSKEPAPAMSSDDLLPLLVYLVVKADIPNWLANLTFMMNFRFSSFADGEFGFYLASIEAAVEHVKMGNMSNVVIGAANPQKLHVLRKMMSADSMWQNIDQNDVVDTSAIDVFFQHAREGHTTEVAKMLEQSSNDQSWLLDQMCHPLCGCDKCEELVATKRNDPRAVTASSRDDRGCTAMHVAAMYGHTDVINVLILRGGDINATDYHGSTPLHVACSRGQQHVTLLLLDEGASVNIEDNDGNTPLHLCCANGHEECVKAMMYSSQSVDVNAANCQGDTPLHLTTRWGYESLVKILLEHGASVEARNRRKETPIMCSYNVNVSRSLQQASQNADGKDNYIQASSPPIASSFSPPDSTDSFTTSFAKTASRTRPRSRRSSSPYSKMVEKLLRSVADGDLLMVKYQLGWLSDTDESDDDEEISLDAKLCHPLCQCSKCATLQKRTLVSSSGLSVNSCNSEGFSPLHVAAVHGHDAMVSLFIRRGSNINSRSGGSQQCTPLHLACQYNHPLVVIQLLQHGAKSNIKDARGNTPLHYCCLNGHVKPARFLIKHGANVNQTNHRGNTPLHEAARWNFCQAVRSLIEEGRASPFARNKAQLMPIQLTQNDDVVKILRHAALTADHDLEEVSSPDPGSDVTDEPTNSLPSHVASHPLARQTAKTTNESSPPNLGTAARHVSPKDLFFSSGSVEMQQLQALNQSVRAFDKSKRLRRSVTQDRSESSLERLRHQYSIEHFDRRKLRHVATVDKSQPMHIIRAPSLDEAEAPRQGVESWISGNTQHQEGSSWAGGEEDEATDHTQDGIAEETKDGATDTALTKEPHASDRRRTIEDDGSNLKNPQVEKETVQSNASTFANLNASRSEQDCVKAEEHLAIKDDANPLQEQEAGESRSRAKKHKSIVSFVEPETRHDPGEPTREQRTEGMVVGGSKAEPGEVFSAELREDNGAESALVATEVSTATDANASLSTDAVGGSTHQLPPLTEMQDVTATFHSIPTSPGHRRIGSNVSLDEMTSLTQSMNAYAESLPPSSPTGGSGDLAESTVGFVEALRGKSREDLSDAERLAQQREALMSSPLTDSEIDCMEPLNQDGHIS